MKVRSRALYYSVLTLLLALGNTSQAATGFAGGQPWQIGDIIVCFGSGSCNVLRIVNGTPTLLDQFSDGLLGDTHGVAINNTLHLLVADNAGGTASDVVEYTIASVNPQTGVAVAHQLATNSPFNAAGANGQTLAVNASGQIFVGNAGNGSTAPSITELDPNGQKTTGASLPALVLPSNPFTLPASCLDSHPPSVLSMDLSAAGDALYLTSNGGTIRKLTFSSANSGCTTFANFGANVTLYGIKDIPPGALANVSPNCKGTGCPQDEALLVVAIGNTGSDAVNICTNVVDNNPVSCALLLDTNPTSSVVARYPVTGTTTLQSLTLNPLITDCTVSNCSSTLPSPTTSDFWLADSQSANFYKLDFASGTPIPYNANISCGTCTAVTGIQGIGIYGGEGSNQPDLTKLASTSLSSPSYTAVTSFPPNVQQGDPSLNTWTLTAYKLPSGQAPIPITLYASLIPNAVPPSNGNNSGATDPTAIGPTGTLIGTVSCQPTTTDSTKCIIWKADLSMPTSPSYLSEVIGSPTGLDNGTDVFVDLHYDVTSSTGFGDLSTSGGSKGSVHSLHEITSQFTNGGANPSGCTYSSPVENMCYKTSRTTLNFIFQCSGLTQQQFLNLQNPPGPPDLSLVERFPTAKPKPAPQTIFLSGTNSKAPYRFDSPSNSYTFQWNLRAAETSGQINPNSTSTMRGCTFDPTGTVQTFCVDFTLDPTCK